MPNVILTLICHAATEATRTASFPADEPLEAVGLAAARTLAAKIRRVDAAFNGPALRTRQTADALGLTAGIDPACGTSTAAAGRDVRWRRLLRPIRQALPHG